MKIMNIYWAQQIITNRMVIISIIITIINVIGMCVIMHTLDKQNLYDDLLKHYEEALRLIGKQDSLIQARLWHNASENQI